MRENGFSEGEDEEGGSSDDADDEEEEEDVEELSGESEDDKVNAVFAMGEEMEDNLRNQKEY